MTINHSILDLLLLTHGETKIYCSKSHPVPSLLLLTLESTHWASFLADMMSKSWELLFLQGMIRIYLILTMEYLL